MNHGPTEGKILLKAQQLLQERGYQFFSFQDLADSVGIRKASVHHHFKTKDKLAERMVADYMLRIETWFAEIDSKKLKPKKKLLAYFNLFRELSCNGKNVCPGGSLLLDWHNFSKPIRAELRKMISLHHLWLIRLLKDAALENATKLNAKEIPIHATLIGASLQGGLQIARASPDPEKVLHKIFKHIEAITLNGRNG